MRYTHGGFFCRSTDVKKYKMVELFNSVYIVDVKVHVFLDKGLWPKYWVKSKIIKCV